MCTYLLILKVLYNINTGDIYLNLIRSDSGVPKSQTRFTRDGLLVPNRSGTRHNIRLPLTPNTKTLVMGSLPRCARKQGHKLLVSTVIKLPHTKRSCWVPLLRNARNKATSSSYFRSEYLKTKNN